MLLLQRLFSCLLIFWLLMYPAYSQTPPSWLWAQQVGTPANDNVHDVTTDAQGNTYQVGSFNGTLQVGSFTLASSSSSMYLIKRNPQGQALWAKQTYGYYPGTAPIGSGQAVVTDGAGNVYIMGSYIGAIILENIPLICPGYNERIFIAKYDAGGNFLWVQQAGDDNFNIPMDIAVDNTGNILVAGYYDRTTLFGTTALTSQGGNDMFLAKYTPQGALLWVVSGGGPGDDDAVQVRADAQNNVYITGGFGSSALFGSVGAIGYGGTDGFLAKYSPQGVVQWVKSYGGTGEDNVSGILLEPNGTIYLNGTFAATAYLGAQTLTSQGGSDGFLARCDAQGNVVWARGVGGSGDESFRSLVGTATGSLYSLGSFNGTVTVGAQTMASTGAYDMLLVSHDRTGNPVWATQAGGTGSKYGRELSIASTGLLTVTVAFLGSAQFGPFAMTSRGSADAALLQLRDNSTLSTHSRLVEAIFDVYPNPVTGKNTQVTLPISKEGLATLQLCNALGQVVWQQTVQASSIRKTVSLETHSLPNGTYLLRYTDAQNYASRRITVTRQ